VTTWAVERAVGSATAFHARPLPDPAARLASVLEVDRPALVLGSTQDPAIADGAVCAAAGVEVVRRRSGGAAVLLDPGQVLWVDLILPRGDPLWDDDVGRAATWVGRAWAAALATVAPDADRFAVHEGPMVRTPWSDLACFAGLGPGEVVRAGPRAWGPPPGRPAKVVGVSQRRNRAGVRFQCACALAWDPARLAGLLALPASERDRLAADIGDAVHPVTAPASAVVDALLTSMPM
jgi:lipoate-protein ligase A